MNLLNSYNNPFTNRDANTDSIEDIVSYWCEPLHIQLTEMLTSNKTIVIEGPRGCGKTTIFKYYSLSGQMSLGKSVPEMLINGNYICAYYRIGEYNYSSLSGKGIDSAHWNEIFVHLFELKISKLILECILKIVNSGDQSISFKEVDFIAKVARINGFHSVTSLENVLELLDNEIRKVKEFTRQRSFQDVVFSAPFLYNSYEISEKFIESFNECIHTQLCLNVAIIVDEMENLATEHQKVINTYIKFVKENITFRIGSRPSGITTLSTLSMESLRESHDYNKITINSYMDVDKYVKFLNELANKRIHAVYALKHMSIEDLLGKKENIQEEIRRKIPADFTKHLEFITKTLNTKDVELIRNEDIMKEMLNIVKVNRGNDISDIADQMEKFISKSDTSSKAYRKYKNDFENKYKKSLAFLLLSIAKKNKSYYSMLTFAYLSSGSTRLFLQLCHKVFEYSMFKCPETLLKNEMIDMDIQTEAVRDVAQTEINYLKKVGPYGDKIYNFVDNMCRIFQQYHQDPRIKYPETNQFTLDDSIDDISIKVLDIAKMHSFILLKNNLQQKSIGLPKTNIYTVNRIYSPLYNISCVTRGGYNPYISSEVIREILNKQLSKNEIMKYISTNNKTISEEAVKKEEATYQITIGDIYEENNI